MDDELTKQLKDSLEFLTYSCYEIEMQKVTEMLNPTTKRESEIFDEYANVMEELNDIENDDEYFRYILDLTQGGEEE